MNSCKYLILASGTGSNAEALMKTAKENNINVCGLFSDKSNAEVLTKAKKYEVKTFTTEEKDNKDEIFFKLSQVIEELKPDWLLLAGFMRILPTKILQRFFDKELQQYRVINIHPSLLPKYPGLGGYRQAYENGDTSTGLSIHFVDEGLDTGKLILQKSFSIAESKNLEEVIEKGKSFENKYFPEILLKIHNGNKKDLLNELSF